MRRLCLLFLLYISAIAFAKNSFIDLMCKQGKYTGDLTEKMVDQLISHREDIVCQTHIGSYLLSHKKIYNNVNLDWKLARLIYFIGNYGIGETQYLHTAKGITLFYYGAMLAKKAMSLAPKMVNGYYWFAVDIGSYGLARGILVSAVHVPAAKAALHKSIALDVKYRWYGASAVLARYYHKLPFLLGGSDSKAKSLFLYTIKHAPEYDVNWLYLGRFYLSTGEYQNAYNVCKHSFYLKDIEGKFESIRHKREALECMQSAKTHL